MDSADQTGLRTRVEIRSTLGDLATQWDALVDLQPLPSPFMRSWWIDNATSAVPAVVCVLRGSELIGGAAFEVDTWGPSFLGVQKIRVSGAGLLAPDHIDLIAAPGCHETVAREVLGWLLRPGSRFIHLDGLTANGTLASLFADEVLTTFDAPLADLPSDFGDYVASRPGKVRSTIKRRTKQLVAEGVTHSVAERSDLDRAIDSFSVLHDLRWAEESGFLGAFERFRKVLAAAADQDELVVNELRLATGETIAVEIDFRIANRLFFYQAGRRTEREWRGCGTVLRAKIIAAAIDDGVIEYDMLRGDEPYKTEWATARRQLSSHRLAVGTRARIGFAARSAIDRANRRLRAASND